MKTTKIRQKFGDMKDGTHFTDGRVKFIKLQSVLPSGGISTYSRGVMGTDFSAKMNAVYYDGCPANVPDRCEYYVIQQ